MHVDQYNSTKEEYINDLVNSYNNDEIGWHDIQDITMARCMVTKEDDNEILTEIDNRLRATSR